MRTGLLLLPLLLALSTPARAAGFFGPDPEESPSVFSYAFRGLGTGAIIGAAGGYIVARNDDAGFDTDAKTVLKGTGIGALIGGATGLTLGLIDVSDDRPGMGNLTLRDMQYGSLFGAAAGAIGGTLVMLDSEEPEHILYGASIGTVSGALVGIVVGIVEGRRIIDSPAHRRHAERPFTLTFTALPDGEDGMAFGPMLSGSL